MLLISAIAPAFAALPITFEENRGQARPEVAFVSRAAGYRVFLTKSGAVITAARGPAVYIGLAHSRSTAPAQTGAAPPSPPPQTVAPVQVMIGGVMATVTYAGVRPGYAGLDQVNAQIPIGTPYGAQSVQIIQNGAASNTVTVAVR